MRNLLTAVTAILFLLCTSPLSAQKAKGDKAMKNLEACKKIVDAITSGDVNSIDNVFADDAIDHAGMHGELRGKDSIKAELAKIHTMSPDMKIETIKEIADNDYVFQWVHFTGTAATSDMGMPVGTKFDLSAIEVSKFVDGKVTEHWEFMQPADMMKMMGPQK